MRFSAVLLFLAACSAADRPWERPWPREPVAKVEPQQRLPSGQYPIDLVTVLRLAGANNLEIAFMREKVHEAYARSQLADERFWPVIGPEYTFRRHEGLTQGTDGTFVDVDKQQTFVGGRLRLRWEVGDALFNSFAASRHHDASLESLKAIELSIVLEAAVAYYDLLREQVRLRTLGLSIEASEKLEKELNVAVQAGRGFKGDVLRARVQATSSRIAQERAREAVRLASIRLSSILRLAPGIELVPAEEDLRPLEFVPLTAKEADLLREALEARPEIREALAERRATEHEQSGATWGPLLPELQVDLAPGALGAVLSDLEGTEDYALTLGWRLGPGGLFDFGRQNLAEARFRQAEIQVERVRQKVIDQVRAAWAQVEARARMLEMARQEVADAEEALKLNEERQAASIGLPLEVLQAEEALTRARLDFYGVLADYSQSQLRLRAALGRRPE